MLVVQKKTFENAQNKWNKTTPHEIEHIAPKKWAFPKGNKPSKRSRGYVKSRGCKTHKAFSKVASVMVPVNLTLIRLAIKSLISEEGTLVGGGGGGRLKPAIVKTIFHFG